MLWLLLLMGCDAAFVEFPATDLTFDLPVVDLDSATVVCSGEPQTFVARVDASGDVPEVLATITTANTFERHPLTVRTLASAEFPARYQLGPLFTGVAERDVVPGESTSLRCGDLSRTSVAIGLLDGFGSAVACVQWLGADADAPDEWQAELIDVGCESLDL